MKNSIKALAASFAVAGAALAAPAFANATAHAPGETWVNQDGKTCTYVSQGLAPVAGFRTGRLPMGYSDCK